MEKRIALVTCSKYPDLTKSDRVLAAALREAGAVVAATDWRDRSLRWDAFDAAVVRSTWDYHLCPEEFAAWVNTAESRTTLVNSPALLRWNANKRYLADLQQRGVRMLPFAVVEPNTRPGRDALDNWHAEVVVKPLVGASAWQISRVPPSNISVAITPELQRTGCLIQTFASEIEQGEYSLMFFDGLFSHAVLKKPARGDFRTQTELGGTVQSVRAPDRIVSQASSVLEALPETPTYARIDGIVQEGSFLLMEAELIEPELFLHLAPEAAPRFAQAILKLA